MELETNPVVLTRALLIACKTFAECPAIYDYDLPKCQFCNGEFKQEDCWFEICINKAKEEIKNEIKNNYIGKKD